MSINYKHISNDLSQYTNIRFENVTILWGIFSSHVKTQIIPTYTIDIYKIFIMKYQYKEIRYVCDLKTTINLMIPEAPTYLSTVSPTIAQFMDLVII